MEIESELIDGIGGRVGREGGSSGEHGEEKRFHAGREQPVAHANIRQTGYCAVISDRSFSSFLSPMPFTFLTSSTVSNVFFSSSLTITAASFSSTPGNARSSSSVALFTFTNPVGL